ncbi:MAG: hypothetical protein AB7S86_01355 [Hydrogenophaga sp.]|uniref:hypothetical protein n=1 Tax=Hydrogenophaga sp. TaxID=1904254 RepID=UPI003D0E3087
MKPTAGYWSVRWRGQAPWRTLFWRDMLTAGSAINLSTGFAALFLISQGQPIAWAIVVHFAPVPYNAFLLRSLWLTPGKPGWSMAVAGVWFAGMLVV